MGSRSGAASGADHWKSTRAQTAVVTRLIGDEADYLGAAHRDIGRLIGQSDRELFVSCSAGDALQQQFQELQPEFVAVHDIGTRLSRQFLAGLAHAAHRPMQTLTIRRQGFGTALASLQFVELATPDGSPMRLYSTEAEADTATRHAVARTLLSFSRLGVMMVGDLPPHSLASNLNPWRDELLRGPWQNRNLLLLPMGAGPALAAQGEQLGQGSVVKVQTAPHVTRPADAWNFVSGAWAQLREQLKPADARAGIRPAARPAPRAEPNVQRISLNLDTPIASAPVPAPQRPAPPPSLPPPPPPAQRQAAAQAAPRHDQRPPTGPASELLRQYTQQVSELGGVLSCCVFDVAARQSRAHAGNWPEAGDLALYGAELVQAIVDTGRHLGLGHVPPDAAITLDAHHLLLRPLPNHPGLVLHAVLDKTRANLMLARVQLQRLDTMLD